MIFPANFCPKSSFGPSPNGEFLSQGETWIHCGTTSTFAPCMLPESKCLPSSQVHLIGSRKRSWLACLSGEYFCFSSISIFLNCYFQDGKHLACNHPVGCSQISKVYRLSKMFLSKLSSFVSHQQWEYKLDNSFQIRHWHHCWGSEGFNLFLLLWDPFYLTSLILQVRIHCTGDSSFSQIEFQTTCA